MNCAICCENIENECDGFKTPCNHHMHNTCLTHWLLLKNTCPICRHNICGDPSNENQEIEEFDEDEDYDEINGVEVNFLNEVYTSSYDTILDGIKELIYCLTLSSEEQDEYSLVNNWCFDETNMNYYLKLNTRKEIINITITPELINNILYLDIEFNSSFKKNKKYICHIQQKDIYVSNYSPLNLPTRINCY